MKPMPRERPALFGGAMVRSILDGSKTRTRRPTGLESAWELRGENNGVFQFARGEDDAFKRCPHGDIGDRLWVRETWRTHEKWDWASPAVIREHDSPRDIPIKYDADEYTPDAPFTWGKGRPSIHMPRWASRIDLEITGVRVERVQDITNADAIAEGIRHRDGGKGRYGEPLSGWSWEDPHPIDVDPVKGWERCLGTARFAFGNLWNSIYGNWDANPWCWVVEFTRTRP